MSEEIWIATVTTEFAVNVDGLPISTTQEIFRGSEAECRRIVKENPMLSSDDKRKIKSTRVYCGTLESWEEFLKEWEET